MSTYLRVATPLPYKPLENKDNEESAILTHFSKQKKHNASKTKMLMVLRNYSTEKKLLKEKHLCFLKHVKFVNEMRL